MKIVALSLILMNSQPNRVGLCCFQIYIVLVVVVFVCVSVCCLFFFVVVVFLFSFVFVFWCCCFFSVQGPVVCNQRLAFSIICCCYIL